MVINQDNMQDLRGIFCNAVINIFGGSTAFLDFIENEEYDTCRYDCYVDDSGENYIINRDTGEYINWYKLNHIGRCINISVLSNLSNISEWLESFLVEFKRNEVKDMNRWDKLYNWLNDTRLANAPESAADFHEYTARVIRHDLIGEIIEYMEELDEEEYDET